MPNTDWLSLVPGWENSMRDQYGIPADARPLVYDNPYKIGVAYIPGVPSWLSGPRAQNFAPYLTNAAGQQVQAIPYMSGGPPTETPAEPTAPGATPADTAAAQSVAGYKPPPVTNPVNPQPYIGANGVPVFGASGSQTYLEALSQSSPWAGADAPYSYYGSGGYFASPNLYTGTASADVSTPPGYVPPGGTRPRIASDYDSNGGTQEYNY